MTRFQRFARRACHLIFSLLFILTILVSPLLTALPAYADWGADIRLTYNTADSYLPCPGGSGNTIHIVWQDNRDGNWEIYYKRSTDSGTTWGADTRLTNGPADSQNLVVAVLGNNVNIVWQDNRDGNFEIYYKRSTNGGTTWGADTRLTNDPAFSQNPVVAVSGNNVHVVWYDGRDGNPEIYYKRSTDGGTTWGTDTRLTNDPADSSNPVIAVSGNNVHAVWPDNRDGNFEIYYKNSTDGGTTWGADTRLSTGPLYSFYPVVAVSGNNVHVTWNDERDGNHEIYYKRSMDGGATWCADTRLTNALGVSGKPVVTVSENNVHIVWHDNRNGNYAIYYKYSTDGGTTWGADTRLSTGMANSYFPVGTNIFVVWYDNRDGNFEIYYKRYTGVPAVNSINPSQGIAGQTLDNVIITGANFTGATRVSFGTGITVNSFHVISDTQIQVSITITSGAAPGAHNISVTTPGGTGTLTGGFTVVQQNSLIGTNAPTPHGASATTPAIQASAVSLPNILVQSASLSASKVSPGTPITVTATVANRGTVNGSTRIKLYVNGEEDSSQGITVESGSNTPVTFNVSRNEPGTYTVYVGGTNAGSFIVDELAGPGAVAVSVSVLFLLVFIAGIIVYRRNSRFS